MTADDPSVVLPMDPERFEIIDEIGDEERRGTR